MNWGKNENRVAVIALHKCGHSPTVIFKLLRNLEISLMFVHRTIKRYAETSSVEDLPRSGRPRSVRTPALVKAVKARILRNPVRKQKLMAFQMKLSRETLKRVINQDLGLHAYKKKTGHLLNARLKKIRKERSQMLVRRYANNEHRSILFSDEKIFTIEEHFNKQNDRVYAHSSAEASEKISRVQRGHHPSSVMVWLGVSYLGPTEVHFCQKGVKTGAKVYQDDVLEKVVKPLKSTMFRNQAWVFQQDSAPAHKAKSTQEWFERQQIDFIRHADWPSSSPDLNPLDYKIWSYLEEKVCAKPQTNLETLKSSIVKAVANIDMNVVRNAIDDWPRRLRACINAQGGHFE